MAAAAGKKSTTSLSLYMEACGFEVEEELSTTATQFWAEVVWIGKWPVEQKEAWKNQAPEVQTWRQVRGPAGAVLRETRDVGIKWPHWHTLIFEGDGRIDTRHVCPKDVKKMLLQQVRTVFWKLAAKHEYEEFEGCRRNSSTLVGRTKVNVKLVTRRKAQKSTCSTIVRVGMKLGAKSQRPAESGSKKREPQKRSGSGKEVLLRMLSVKANGTGAT